MLKRIVAVIVAVGFVWGSLGIAFADESGYEGNKRKGKYTYRKVYKTCHERGGSESATPTLNPDAKTQAQWKAVFENKQFEEFGCAEEWKSLSDEDLKDIFSYLHDHAADSPTPAKCQ